ncbi:hypothetical protein HBI81_019350 [Parastagonospora nodorum]|nr:hypothetical protein HBH53_218450 [Parastagonospora nodorum]KAH4164983.1 hypothetical protein HBH43_147970 [Parastagonospora nodorum]KAH4256984.1 hypothetical protein HBI03_160580 [Parastagonospora nodorum]KAH4270118.1 hypothetical protein HBI04_155580 [Parastagonospora nodorum]KAH4962467.1 hypothetical protein HBI78_127140 [Parastagonospora nodorum]
MYRDPESLQVAQVLSRQDPVGVFEELHRSAGGHCHAMCRHRDGLYSEISCPRLWLVECAKLGPNPANDDQRFLFVRHLHHLKTPQPVYESADLDHGLDDAVSPGPFTRPGVLFAVAEYAARENGARDIESLVHIIARAALDIVDIWDYTYRRGYRQRKGLPPFKWYYLGLVQSRKIFADMIEDCADTVDCMLSYQMRDFLKSVPFITIWDWLWQAAGEKSNFMLQQDDALDCDMYLFALVALKDTVGLSASELRRIVAVVDTDLDLYWNETSVSNMVSSRPSGYPVLVDFDHIESTGTHYMERHWGRQFYENHLPPGFSTDLRVVADYDARLLDVEEDSDENVPEELLRDIYDSADLEVHGPSIDALEFAQTVGEDDRPRRQNCTICADIFVSRTAKAICLRLRECGHYFHDHCLRDWMNSVAACSNLCPECRSQICENRRPVRLVDTGPPEETPTQAVRPAPVTGLEVDQLRSQSDVARPYATNVLPLVSPTMRSSLGFSHLHSTFRVLFAEPEEVIGELFSNNADSTRQQDLSGPATSLNMPDTEAAMRDVGYASVVPVPDPHRGDIEVREEPQDETGAADGESEYEALFGNLDKVPGGFALPDPDDIESFGAAGMTNGPHTPTRLQEYFDDQWNYIEDRVTFHTHGDDRECPFAWDMDYDNDSDEE